MKHTFRASFSILNLWANGRKEDAIKSYFKLPRFVTKEMEDGINYHRQWSDEIKRTSALPKVFGGLPIGKFETEIKHVIPITDWCDFVFVPDLVHVSVLTDFKTGTGATGEYLDSQQLPVYALMLAKEGVIVDRGVIRKYNQYEKKVEVGFVWLTPARLADAKKWLIENITSMSDYFDDNQIWDKYPDPREVVTFDL